MFKTDNNFKRRNMDMNSLNKELQRLNISSSELEEIRKWSVLTEKIRKFVTYCNLDTFNDIFGKEEGERLFRHFRFDCNHDFIKFRTYLLNNQTNDIFAHIVKIKL